MEFHIIEKVNNSIATKLCANLLNSCRKTWIILVHFTIQWLNCVVHYLNVKLDPTLAEKKIHNFVVHSNESVCRKIGRLEKDQVLIYVYRLSLGYPERDNSIDELKFKNCVR